MRNRWEDRADADLDAPITITEREWRALRRRAGFGVPAVLLGCIAVGGLGWALYAGPEGLEQIQDVKERYIARSAGDSEAARTEPATAEQQNVRVSDTAPVPAVTADSAAGTAPPPTGASGTPEETRRAATQGSGGH